MADKKISQLTAATALAGTEVVPVVQGGATKKATIDQILTPAAGKGIDFSANTNAPGMTSELLNDYEEGTFTATLAGFVSNPTTPVTTTSRYTKIGRAVTVQIDFAGVDTTGAAGAIFIQGLPFASGAIAIGAAQQGGGMSSTNLPVAYLPAGSTQIEFLAINAQINLSFTPGAGQHLRVNMTYTV